jgi:antitoxin ParD1/3/4
MSNFDMVIVMTTNVSLPPALERFARECVAGGRYSNVSEVVRTGLRLLQEYEEQQRRFEASLDEAMEEADREGTVSVAEVLAEARAIIDAKRKCTPHPSRAAQSMT